MSESTELGEQTIARKKRPVLTWIIVIVLVLGAAAGMYVWRFGPKSPVPKHIRNQVSFHIYYPDQNKMPAGYTLDIATFRIAQPGVVLFSVSYGNGRSMVFSEEAQPGGDVVSKFVSSAIPINNALSTPIGKATVGAYGSGKDLRTLASLPIANGPWLILTAPSDINQTDLINILRSLTK